ncbi:MAG TPA: hypothetical protein VLI05_01215 [Candidatus Saccharimonadia bacterium]|nr:hypothetical protein [Candidatus Saccharimonadia bacterium]
MVLDAAKVRIGEAPSIEELNELLAELHRQYPDILTLVDNGVARILALGPLSVKAGYRKRLQLANALVTAERRRWSVNRRLRQELYDQARRANLDLDTAIGSPLHDQLTTCQDSPNYAVWIKEANRRLERSMLNQQRLLLLMRYGSVLRQFIDDPQDHRRIFEEVPLDCSVEDLAERRKFFANYQQALEEVLRR